MEHAYAQALYEIVTAGKTPAKAVGELRRVLSNRGRLSLLPRIKRAFLRLAARESGKSDVVLTVARAKDIPRAKREAKAQLKGIQPVVRIDESQIGGWRVEGRGTLVDASFKKSLLDMYNAATK